MPDLTGTLHTQLVLCLSLVCLTTKNPETVQGSSSGQELSQCLIPEQHRGFGQRELGEQGWDGKFEISLDPYNVCDLK